MSDYARYSSYEPLLEADGRQNNGMADYRDLGSVLRHAQRGWTIDFKPAVLAALIRIEERLAKIESKGCSCR